MDNTATPNLVGQQEPIAGSGLDFDGLQIWYGEYMSGIRADAAIKAVESDKLHYHRIERLIKELAASTDVAEGFCAKCQYFLNHWPDRWSSHERTFDTLELEAAATAGCKFCGFLLSRLRSESLLDIYRKVEGRLQVLHCTYKTHWIIWDIDFLNQTALSEPFHLSFPSNAHNPYDSQIKIECDIMDTDFSEVESLDMVKKWLHECSEGHGDCHSKVRHTAPTRLVWIGSKDIKLVLTNKGEQTQPYAALSYCWGLEPFTMLTSETFDTFTNAMRDSEFPKTFRDAIHVARELGLSYIWIDALCIIQGDKDDWNHEAGRMRSVYGGSHVTIAASSATNAHQGFLQKQHHHNNGLHVRITAGDHCRRQSYYSLRDHRDVLSRSALVSRAWAFQERLLSSRILYCSNLGFFWECRSMNRSEYIPWECQKLQSSSFVCPENQSLPWSSLVELYSHANLTRSSDRLPALSGIAMRQYEVEKDQYLAGMWRKNLVYQLLWSKREHQLNKRPKWQAPTWSWASINGGVTTSSMPPSSKTKHKIRVLDVCMVLSGPETFGSVSGGELTLVCAYILKGSMGYSLENKNPNHFSPESDLPWSADIFVPFKSDCLNEPDLWSIKPIYLLPVLVEEDYPVKGLVLQRCGNKAGQFRRIGMFDHGFKRALLQLMVHDGTVVAKKECARIMSEPVYQSTPYVITIE
ncbi:HET-domain-containing protein [Apiospora sp. TS-2023a]